jgi:predicted AAA+ superfamily ATPase
MEAPVFKRLLSPPVGRHSFFLFGPRQTGKTTLIEGLLDARTTGWEVFAEIIPKANNARKSCNIRA